MLPDPSTAAAERKVRFRPRPADMVAAQRRHYVARLWSRASLISYVVSLLIVGAFIRIGMSDAPWPWIAAVFGGAMAGGILTSLAMIQWYVPWIARRLYRQQRSLQREVEAEWDEDAFRAATEAGHSRTAWTDYFRWREDRDIILLYHAENLFQLLPKRVLAAAQIDDLRSLAARAGLKGVAARDAPARIVA